jgi:hypothetical protein
MHKWIAIGALPEVFLLFFFCRFPDAGIGTGTVGLFVGIPAESQPGDQHKKENRASKRMSGFVVRFLTGWGRGGVSPSFLR